MFTRALMCKMCISSFLIRLLFFLQRSVQQQHLVLKIEETHTCWLCTKIQKYTVIESTVSDLSD